MKVFQVSLLLLISIHAEAQFSSAVLLESGNSAVSCTGMSAEYILNEELSEILNVSQIALLDDEALIEYILNSAPFQYPAGNKEPGSENPRIVAALLALTLGPFGVHRMYLGTELKVPVFYTLTLGGGLGILPLIDFFYILFSKDKSALGENSKVFMWGEDNKSQYTN